VIFLPSFPSPSFLPTVLVQKISRLLKLKILSWIHNVPKLSVRLLPFLVQKEEPVHMPKSAVVMARVMRVNAFVRKNMMAAAVKSFNVS
jgi:hypothetical protein